MTVIYADFQNADTDGLIRLNCAGSISDLERNQIRLCDGLALTLSDGEIRAEGIVRKPGAEGVWRAEVDWKKIQSN